MGLGARGFPVNRCLGQFITFEPCQLLYFLFYTAKKRCYITCNSSNFLQIAKRKSNIEDEKLNNVSAYVNLITDMIFVKNFTSPNFQPKNFYTINFTKFQQS